MKEELIRPRNGHTLEVGVTCRISGCQNQKELSNDDQADNAREVVAEIYQGEVEYAIISTKGKGERLDRPELELIEAAYRSRKFDLFIFDDLSRLIRGGEAARLLGVGVDNGTRSICINDGIDTNSDTWEEDALNACSENVAHCQRTSLRIKQKTMNRFKKFGTTPRRLISGYTAPIGATCFGEWEKDLKWEKVIHHGATLLRETKNGAEVAEYFRQVNFPLGPRVRNEAWDGNMALRYYRNTLLKGMPQRGKMATVKLHSNGKRVSRKNPKGPTYYPAPHLAYFEPAEFDLLIELLATENASYRRKAVNGVDPRSGVSRHRTRPPGNHATCWYCGRHYVWGGNGITKNLMCVGSRAWRCWNSIGFDGALATQLLVRAILDRLAQIQGVEKQFQGLVRAVREEGLHGMRGEWAKLEAEEEQHKFEKSNVMAAVRKYGALEDLDDQLNDLKKWQLKLLAWRHRLTQFSNRNLQLPDSTASLRALVSAQLHQHEVTSFELGNILKKMVPQFQVYLVRLCDGGHLLPRAKVTLDLLGSFADATLIPGLSELLREEITLDLFVPPQRERIREEAVKREAIMEQRQIAADLPEAPTQTAVWKALALDRMMRGLGLSSPYLLVEEPPADYPKLRRHKNPQYRFEMRNGYSRPKL